MHSMPDFPKWEPLWPAEDNPEYLRLFEYARSRIECKWSTYICPSLQGAAYDLESTLEYADWREAIRSITQALGGCYVLDGWVNVQLGKGPREKLPPDDVMRQYRLDWLDRIIFKLR